MSRKAADRHIVYWPAEHSKVFGGFNGNVDCEGQMMVDGTAGNEFDMIDVALTIPLTIYNAMSKAALQAKLEMCDLTGDYYKGFISVECEAVEDGSVIHQTSYDKEGNIEKEVDLPVFAVKWFNREIDLDID